MANENVSQRQAADAYNKLQSKLMQLNALLLVTYGESAEALNTLNNADRDAYMWACSDLASECSDLVDKFQPKAIGELAVQHA